MDSHAPEPAPSADVADSEDSPLRTLGWVAVGAAAVALGATAYFIVKQRQAAADYKNADLADDQIDYEAEAKDAAQSALALGITTGVLAAGGVTLLIIAPSAPTQSGAVPATDLGFGLQFTGSF